MTLTNEPQGELELQTATMPKDTNAGGDIFGGWIMSQMDIACALHAAKAAKGRAVTVSVEKMCFLVPVKVGSIIGCYCRLKRVGNTSLCVAVEVWMTNPMTQDKVKVTEGEFVFVALDEQRKPMKIDRNHLPKDFQTE